MTNCKRSEAVDLLRAAAVLYIVGFWHALNYTNAIPNYPNPVTYRLTVIALGLFTFLSGYLAASKELPVTAEGVLAFYKRRLIRIWPLYALALLTFVAYGITPIKTAIVASTGISMVYGGPPLTLWFVTMLLMFCLIAPPLILASRRPFIFTAVVVTLFFVAHHFQIDPRLSIYFPAFALGIFAASHSAIVGRIPLLVVAVACGAALFVSARGGFPETATESIGIASLIPLFGLLLTEKLLGNSSTPRFLRAISYAAFAMYLFHRPIYITLSAWRPNDHVLQLLFLWGLCLPAVFMASYGIQRIYDALIGRLFPKEMGTSCRETGSSVITTDWNSRRPGKYRPEIDGLRAVAVLCVLLFHAGFAFMPGGFVGVDVFFVISGFLITGLLVSEFKSTDRISFSAFYIRRALRIIPALVATIALSLAAGALVLSPERFAQLSSSGLAALFSVSNFYFWSQSGYFDASNSLKPLLHTWSLGVEEQFYLVWPLLIFFAAKLRIKGAVAWAVSLTALVSFAASLWWLNDRSSIYYLLPFRAFELALGALLCVIGLRQPRSKLIADLLFITGLMLILFCATQFTPQTFFPSYNALWPCFGAALIVYTGSSRASLLISNPLAVAIGLISYSLYLVHWPIVVFYQLARLAPLDLSDKLAIIALSIAAAIVLHFAVERPSRWKAHAIGKPYFKIASLAVISVTVAFPIASATSGWSWRYSPEVLSLIEKPPRATHSGCFLGPNRTIKDIPANCYKIRDKNQFNVMLAGDSTADHLYPGLVDSLGANADVYSWASSLCPPVLQTPKSAPSNCAVNNATFFHKILAENHYDLVVFSTYKNWPAMIAGFGETAAIMDRLGIRFVLVGQTISFKYPVTDLIARHGTMVGIDGFVSQQINTPCGDEHGLDKLAVGRFFSIQEAICSEGKPVLTAAGKVFQIDEMHFTVQGSKFVGQHLASWLASRDFIPLKGESAPRAVESTVGWSAE